jgi:hypothetical protein
VSGCAALGQLGDAVSQDRFISFALSQAPGQLQRHGHFIVVFAQESDPGLIELRQTMRARKEPLCAQSSDRTDPGQLRYW